MEHLQALARELGVNNSSLLGERHGEEPAAGAPNSSRFVELLQDYDALAGLRTRASDAALVSALATLAPWFMRRFPRPVADRLE